MLGMVQTGYDFLEKGWVDSAITAFQAALGQNANDPKALLGLAIAFERAGQDENAWRAYQSLLQAEATNETALGAVGRLGSYRPEWQAVGIQALDQLLALRPGDDAMRAQRALLLGYQQRFDEAIADYDRLLFADDETQVPSLAKGLDADNLPPPLGINLLVNAAQIYTYRDRTETALALFEQYRAWGGPLNAPATFAYATALRKQGQAAQAIALLEQFSPDGDDQAFEQAIALALAHQANGDPSSALASLQPSLQALPQGAQQRLALANALVPIPWLPAELLPVLETLLQDSEPVTFLHFRAAQIQLAQGDLAGARANLLAYQTAGSAGSAPDLGTMFLLAELDRREGDLGRSGDRYESLLTLAEGQAQWDALRGLAAIRFEQGRWPEAERLYRQALAHQPQDGPTRQTFAELLLAQDKPKQALEQFERAQLALAQLNPAEAEAGGAAGGAIAQRQRTVQRGFLKRRGFQPRWERY
jgi:tetratricopeptide (TPR) repeat protein